MAKAKTSRSRSWKSPTFPTAEAGEEEQESLAKSVIEKLGLYEEFPAIRGGEGDGGGDVKSE